MKHPEIRTLRTAIIWVSALLLPMLLTLFLTGCVEANTSADKLQAEQTELMHSEAVRQVGMPEITNFQELRFAKMITEMRDTSLTTYTYTIDMNGNRHFLCQSVGYGLPYSTQMTNPQRAQRGYHTTITLPQPEPNGLFMPEGVAATWVLCLDPSTEKVVPVYVEPLLVVSPFKLERTP